MVPGALFNLMARLLAGPRDHQPPSAQPSEIVSTLHATSHGFTDHTGFQHRKEDTVAIYSSIA